MRTSAVRSRQEKFSLLLSKCLPSSWSMRTSAVWEFSHRRTSRKRRLSCRRRRRMIRSWRRSCTSAPSPGTSPASGMLSSAFLFSSFLSAPSCMPSRAFLLCLPFNIGMTSPQSCSLSAAAAAAAWLNGDKQWQLKAMSRPSSMSEANNGDTALSALSVSEANNGDLGSVGASVRSSSQAQILASLPCTSRGGDGEGDKDMSTGDNGSGIGQRPRPTAMVIEQLK